MKPRVGQKVIYFGYQGQQLKAEIVHVWTEACVNLRVEDGSEPTSVMHGSYFRQAREDGKTEHFVSGCYWVESDEKFGFGQALEAMKQGQKVARYGWNGVGQWAALQVPDEHSKMKRPYFYIHPVDGNLVPWVPSVSDCLAEDWAVVE